MTELLNCPFCGWATGLSVFDGGDQPYWVECPDCCAQGSPEETKAEAIAAWNTRASDAEITRLTEALRAAYERERDAVMSAYCAGATDVHNSWVEGTNGGEADFGEAASDYYSSLAGAKP